MALPKYRMPQKEHLAAHAYQVVIDELMLDGNSRQNLATFCQTWVEPEVRAIMAETLDKNMIDKDEYPQTAEIEARCVHILADLWNSPEAANTLGTSTTGSSEAAMLGGMALLWNWRARQRAAGKPTDKPNMICGPVQVCWHKFARYWDVELREIPMEGDRLHHDRRGGASSGSTRTPSASCRPSASRSPVSTSRSHEVSDALDKLQEETGLDIPIHVDGASGGFIAPFTEPDLVWDFRLPRVKSINTSGHKFGLAPLGVGWVVWRDAAELPEDLIFNVNYLGGNMPTFALNFSRPGGQIVAQYYNFVRLGREGYRKVHQACHDTAKYLAGGDREAGPLRHHLRRQRASPASRRVSWKLKEGVDHPFTLFDLADRLRTRGWQVPAYTMPADRQDLAVQRILVRQGFSRDEASLLMDDYRRRSSTSTSTRSSTP